MWKPSKRYWLPAGNMYYRNQREAVAAVAEGTERMDLMRNNRWTLEDRAASCCRWTRSSLRRWR